MPQDCLKIALSVSNALQGLIAGKAGCDIRRMLYW